MKCLHCGKECFEDKYPEVVFKDGDLCVCEECSIDYEQKDGKIQVREDLKNRYKIPLF